MKYFVSAVRSTKRQILTFFLILLGISIITNCASSQSINEQNAYLHLYEIMDKYHKHFDVYSDQGSGGNHYSPSGLMGDHDDIMINGDWAIAPHLGIHCMKVTYSADFFQDNHYIPSGWMGDYEDIAFDDAFTNNPHSGETCIKIDYSALSSRGEDWAGIYWQDPENNWGDKEGGYDLSGVKRMTFWARGEKGGERAEFKVGGINRFPHHNAINPYQDSCDVLSTGIIILSDEWTQYSIDLVNPDYFGIYTDKDAGSNNHYTPSGWYNGSENMAFDDDWRDNPHSGSSCIKVTWDGTPGDDTWRWNGVAWQQPEGNWNGDSGYGYNLTGATKLTFYARTDDPGLVVKFLVGYPQDSSGEVLADEDGWIELGTEWPDTPYEIDLTNIPPGKDLSDIACGFAFIFNDVYDPDPDGCTFYLDDIKFDKVIVKDLSHVIGGFCWVTDRDSNPDGCTFYLDSIRYEYEDKNFNVYSDAQNNWAGVYWQYPEENWGDDPGYDLTGATKLTFWAKGETGGEKGEFKVGGINCSPYHDPSKAYQDSCGSITTGVITLTDAWQQYTIDLAGRDLGCLIGGFCWVTNNTQNPDGCVFYLDDIRYDKERLDELRFLLSYETTTAPEDKYIRNMADTYDNVLAMLAFMARGTPDDWTRAKIIGDSFIYCQDYDRYFDDGRLRNAYQAGDIADSLTGKTRLPGWWNEQEQRWDEDEEQVGSHTGNMAWVIIAWLRYHKLKGEGVYLDASIRLAQWIVDNCYDERGAGGYTGGFNGWEPSSTSPLGQKEHSWKSTEHNIDVYVAFMMLYEATGDSLWRDYALHAKNFVEAIWDDTENHFWTGTLDDGESENRDAIPLDAQTWGLMALGAPSKYDAGITWAEENCLVDPCPNGCGFRGFDFNADRDGVWFEGTAQMCIAFQIKDELGKSDEFIDEIREAQISATESNGKGIVAACHDGVTTGFELPNGSDWVYYNRLHVGATSWYIFAERRYNPYWPDEPIIEFTYVPPCGSFEDLEGRIVNVAPDDHRVAVYICVAGGWWTKPYWSSPLTIIEEDGTWTCDITTGGNDQDATEIMAYLVPDGYNPPAMSGQCLLPEELGGNSIANAKVIRPCGYRRVTFSGYSWRVKSSASKLGPGPNYFSDSEENVWVDTQDRLHLRITERDGKWYCAEVILEESFGYGKYSFHLANRVDGLNENVVLGLFTWDDCFDPTYGNREIDIEFARWGDVGNDNAQFVVQPYNLPGNMHRFSMQQTGGESIHAFTWHEDSTEFRTTYDGSNELWTYTGGSIPRPGSENARINLWLFNAQPPSDSKETEVIIEKFEYAADSPSTLTMEMEEGWYLISLPLQSANTDPDAVLDSIRGKYNSVWAYDPSTGWSIYVPGGVSDLTEMETGYGYWVKMDEAGTLEFHGKEPDQTAISLIGGKWNLVGYSCTESRDPDECMSSVAGDINSVWEFDPNAGWSIYAPGGISDLQLMKPGYGYWIKADNDCTWDVNAQTALAAPSLRIRRAPTSTDKPTMPCRFWGSVTVDGKKIEHKDITVILKVDNQAQDSHTLETASVYGSFYALNVPGHSSGYGQFELYVQVDDSIIKAANLPSGGSGQIVRFDLSVQRPPKISMAHQNYPNPFNPDTRIPYQLSEDTHVEIRIYSSAGQLVRTLNLGHKSAGYYVDRERAAHWDGRNEAGEQVASDIYFYSIKAGGLIATKKMVLAQ